jgi:hypothetical protein
MFQGQGAEYGAPVDTVAAAIVALGLDSQHRVSFGQMYHTFDTEPVSYVSLFTALGSEYELTPLPQDMWLEAVKSDPQNVARPLLHELEAMTADSALPLFANDGTVAALAKLDRKLGPNLDYAHAKRQLEFLRGMRMVR